MAAERIHASQGRLGFLDWTRGLGALIMLQGHVMHSFLAKDLREGSAFVLSQFIGGMPPAFFLFLTGVTLGFLMDSLSKKEPSLWNRITAALYRARYLFVIAFLFRLQMWAFAWPYAPFSDVIRVDVLNCMGFTVAALSWLVIFDTRQRVLYAAVVGLLIACCSPLVSNADWSGIPLLIKQYLAPDANFFSFFPWGAFLAFGISAGSVIRIVPAEDYGKMMQWSVLLGLAVILVSNYFSNIPYSLYQKSDFWLDGPGLILIKTGVVFVLAGFGFLWMTFQSGRWSWIATLGQHSLPVYWLHIELVYGRWLGYWKETLSLGQTMVLSGIVIALMVALAEMKGRYDRGEWPGLRLAIGKYWPIGA
ncbi:MAG: heparan-alpha-glucosaminide N-acetyltransferase domain-containing protein [Acidobacteria bacterium]|nr:heparan-alpha-glucosaminide N-acetyltransferase domain-containing protein [Acidobacteriota bacterium]